MRSLPILPIILLSAIILGTLVGYYFPSFALMIKPLGELFLNLIFTLIIPLLFFSVAAASTRLAAMHKLSSITFALITGFLGLGFLATLFMYSVLFIFPLHISQHLSNLTINALPTYSLLETMVTTLTTENFYQLFSREHLMALIIFAALCGVAGAKVQATKIAMVFEMGSQVCLRMMTYIMYYAPIGIFAYIAAIIAEMPRLVSTFLYNLGIYYAAGSIYGLIIFSSLVFLFTDKTRVMRFWHYTFLPVMIGAGTLSSAAALPSNILAAQRMGVPNDIFETVLPVGTLLHKQGTILGAMLKIGFLFSIYHLNLWSVGAFLSASFIAILAGSVMGAVPGGGMLGEMLIVSLYHFPKEALPLIVVIGILIDPLATALNVLGNNVYTLLVTRLVYGTRYLKNEV